MINTPLAVAQEKNSIEGITGKRGLVQEGREEEGQSVRDR